MNKIDYEKYRNELFDIKVQYTTITKFIKWFSIIFGFFALIIAYLGYDKFTSIEEKVDLRVNQRLLKTDSLLSKLDDKRILEINDKIKQKEIEYKQILNNFDSLISQNKNVQDRIFQLLPENQTISSDHTNITYERSATDEDFILNKYIESAKPFKRYFVYITFSKKIKIDSIKHIGLILMKQTSEHSYNVLSSNYFKAHEGINKIFVDINVGKGIYPISIDFALKNKKYYHREYKLKVE